MTGAKPEGYQRTRQGIASGMLSSIGFGIAIGRLNVVATTSEKVRENLLRRVADRQGLALRKSRTRDPRAIDYDRWMIVSLIPGRPDVGTGPTGKPTMTLNEVEANLMGDDA
jgi:hypothetical protein